MTGHETLSAAAKRLWEAQEELCRAAEAVDSLAVNDDTLARTLGDDGEHLTHYVQDASKRARTVALKLNRCVIDSLSAA